MRSTRLIASVALAGAWLILWPFFFSKASDGPAFVLVRHHAIGLRGAMRQREHGPTTPPDVQLQDDMGPIASHAPGSCPRGRGREQRRDQFLRRLGRREPGARGATAGLLREIRGTNLAAAIAARGLMLSTGGLAAYGTEAHLVRCEDRLRLGYARRAVLFADEAARTIRPAQMPGALNLFVHGTHGLVRGADRSAAARALRHLVHAYGLVGAALA